MMPNITGKLRLFLRGKGKWSDSDRKNNEARITKIARKSLMDLTEIVGFSDTKRISKIFKPEFENFLQYIIAKSSMELDDEFRNKIRIGLEAGYFFNSPVNTSTMIPVTTTSNVDLSTDVVFMKFPERDRPLVDSPYIFNPGRKTPVKVPPIEIIFMKRKK
jgi:hypothetical protein